MKSGRCPKCESENVMENILVADYFDNMMRTSMKVEIEGNPSAIFFKEKETSNISAWICADCGFTELYTSDPQTIWRTYQKPNRT